MKAPEASPAQSQTPFSAEESARYQFEFARDGFLRVPGVLPTGEVAALKNAVDEVLENERWKENCYSDFIAVRLFEAHRIFEEMLTREPIISLVENILGHDCHLIAQNVIRNTPGQAIDTFHVDDTVMSPLPASIPRHDARVTLPVFILGVFFPLTDIPATEYGPTEYVSGSHYASREPDDPFRPTFEGRGAVPVLCDASDMVLHNGQCWHRGAPNTSTQTRYLFQMVFAQRWVAQRFYPFVNYQLPQHVLDSADERRKRVLGIHPKGAYG